MFERKKVLVEKWKLFHALVIRNREVDASNMDTIWQKSMVAGGKCTTTLNKNRVSQGYLSEILFNSFIRKNCSFVICVTPF